MLSHPLIRGTGPTARRYFLQGLYHRPSYASPTLLSSRAQSSSSSNPQNNQPPPPELAFDRTALNIEQHETCKWGTDDAVASHQSSYDPSMTSPEIEYTAEEAEFKLEGEDHSPLYVSPANREVSELLDPMVGGAVHCADRLGPSARGWTRKHRVVRIRDFPGSRWKQYEKALERLRVQREGGGVGKDGKV
ncbi:hypothetical protein P170DRAFT_477278 [Aspergillus steynii IBT 23096]|uniref:Uncharacterized protein n=1 Tax=Aspergillus steynii IBT 23096 TaxID=1392250 RepID=A0A2I2G0J1_9EURO|nr:uncharacterized protein P170DRAFT_477278 [Aspergillus steynii IBT 23096]PLB46397.1 hypothetical protein P170DRAFT_477278 [Aspergillus steynii IBT 23096]